jgi:drug/metabolite transporter (DMT)-like permease
MKTPSNNLWGVGFLVLAMLIFSLQDIAVKWIGSNYPILEIVIFRSLVAMPFTLLFFRFEGQRGLPRTKRPRLEYVRGLFFFLSYHHPLYGLGCVAPS